MNPKQGTQGIGRKLREEGRHIVEAQLPSRLAELLSQLEQAACARREARTRPWLVRRSRNKPKLPPDFCEVCLAGCTSPRRGPWQPQCE
jgi:hypothetical protein